MFGLDLAVVVLAAGAGSRFGPEPGAKLLADVDGQPMLARVLSEVRACGPAATVVVLGHGADTIEGALEWGDELRVRNHDPARGLASSLQAGIDTLRALPDPFDGAFIVLGDQPWLRADVMRALAAAAALARPAQTSVIVPRYEGNAGPRNPALLLRPAWAWVDGLEGDRGLGSLIRDRPDRVLEVPVTGEMPDVDRPQDVGRG
jgi:molybdenum cofactor cytidylyltransferase